MYRLFVALCSSLAVTTIQAQTDRPQIQAARTADSLFWQAYNICDLTAMMALTAHDIEFFHDKGGITRGDSAFEASIRNGLCGNPGAFQLRRQKVSGTEGVYPMHNEGKLYGVLFTGKHLFYISQQGKAPYADGLAQYADLWLMENGNWKLARVFSYDHGPAPYVNNRKAIGLPYQILKSFEGVYKGPENEIRVIASSTYLELRLTGGRQMKIYPLNNHSFFAKERDLVFSFPAAPGQRPVMIVAERGREVEQLLKTKK
ncbi:DUF4440 domain-containing protein [Niabella terrae]